MPELVVVEEVREELLLDLLLPLELTEDGLAEESLLLELLDDLSDVDEGVDDSRLDEESTEDEDDFEEDEILFSEDDTNSQFVHPYCID